MKALTMKLIQILIGNQIVSTKLGTRVRGGYLV